MPERSAPRRAAAGRWSPSSASGSGCAEIGGFAFIYWTVALYQLGSILAGAITGIVAARRGLRLAMTVVALIYATGCVISALAPDMTAMLLGGLLQGWGGGGRGGRAT